MSTASELVGRHEAAWALGTQTPAAQAWALGQVLPQVPQLAGSVSVETQAPLQKVWPGPQVVWQFPLEHTCAEVQAFPQAPQLLGSLEALTQVPLQSSWPGLHWVTHEPWLHTCALPHWLPHEPQLLVSLWNAPGATQAVPHAEVPDGQPQTPPVHCSPLMPPALHDVPSVTAGFEHAP